MDSPRVETKTSTAFQDHDREYSDLEVDGRKHFSDPEAIGLGQVGLEVDGRQNFSGLEAVRPNYSNLEVTPGFGMAEGEKEGNLQPYHPGVAGNRDAEGAIPYNPGDEKVDAVDPQSSSESRRVCGLSRRVFFLCLGALIALLLIGGIAGGVIGGKNARKHTTPAGTSGNGTSSPVDRGIRADSNLAALAWSVSSTRYQYKVYYQDDHSNIKESSYNSSTGSWNVTTIVDGSRVSPGTSIAASSSRQAPSGTTGVDVNLYYLDKDLNIALISAVQGVWKSNSPILTSAPDTKSAKANLAAYYHECRLCPNTTLLAYVVDGTVTLYNHTSPEAWKGQKSTVEKNAIDGSEVSLQPYSTSRYADQVNMYYQRTDATLTLSSWFSWQYQMDNNLELSNTNGWQSTGNNAVVGPMAKNASFATLYFDIDVTNGSPNYVEVLTSGDDWKGLQLFEWTPNSWKSPAEPALIQKVTTGTAIAAHFYQRAYVLVDGILTQLSVGNDGTTWTVNAGVPTL